ncbi:helix-turn-helix domain-containing protein [Streptomyces albidoflavus]|uniref:helix-turn-helix domain-containing protein n=1 Tax=Streptomyces albidoflavus TaxID=1886 RepID=UPI0022568138|nr:helix-turn-helix domain-containing protein [Streptomyces albidoflavus]MCX4466342.1 helix-turn-helix domain-containing protein [Streptomyces albidoflavus]WSI92293.1 helix-turn-helix domain-containing protein [Streptomyces albidoflavus]
MTNRPAPTLPTPAERRRLREAASLSQAALAARMSVTSTTIHSWETGRATPRGRALEAYASFLTTTADRPGPAGKPVRTSRSQAGTAVKGAEDKARGEVGEKAEAPPEPARAEASRPRPARPEPPRPSPRPPRPTGATPREAFDALYASCAGVLVRQTYLLTGRHTVAVESVERAFQLAWERWPEVAVDRDPAGWVRAAAHEYALSPWHRMRAAHRRPATPGTVLPPPRGRADHDLMDALLSLAPRHRRTLLLYDGVGLDLPETAAETEATTRAAAHRVLSARAAVAERVPALADPAALHRRLDALSPLEPATEEQGALIRTGGERRVRRWTRSAVVLTAVIAGATAFCVSVAPDHYVRPPAAGEAITGVPPHAGPGPLSEEDRSLREKLREHPAAGPERVRPLPR